MKHTGNIRRGQRSCQNCKTPVAKAEAATDLLKNEMLSQKEITKEISESEGEDIKLYLLTVIPKPRASLWNLSKTNLRCVTRQEEDGLLNSKERMAWRTGEAAVGYNLLLCILRTCSWELMQELLVRPHGAADGHKGGGGEPSPSLPGC